MGPHTPFPATHWRDAVLLVASWTVYITFVATVLAAVGFAMARLLWGRPGWGITVLYAVVMAAVTGVCSGRARSGEPEAAVIQLPLLWLVVTLIVLIRAIPPRRVRVLGK